LVEESVNAVNDATSELNEESIVRDGRPIRGCNMMIVIDLGRAVLGEEGSKAQASNSAKYASLIGSEVSRHSVSDHQGDSVHYLH
jgi:hypothetical protein